MAKKRRKQPTHAAGDAFAVPLEDGRFTVCRVLKVGPTGMSLVVGSEWIGAKVPGADDPALRPVLRLTHHSWNGLPNVAWAIGPPPEEFVPIGTIEPVPEDESLPEPGTGSWGFCGYQALAQWRWDHPEDVPPPEPEPPGRFVLHRFNGDEVYRLEKAVMFAYASEKGVTLWFEAEAARKGAKRCEDTAEMGMTPNAEVGIELKELDADKLVGRKFSVPGTKTDDEDSCMSLLYYCEHEPLRKNKIEVVSRDGDRFRVKWTAVTKDVNYYDGSKPPTKVEIEGEFRFKEVKKWVKAKK